MEDIPSTHIEIDDILLKPHYQNIVFSTTNKPSLMKSTSPKHSLTVIIENNIDEVRRYENRQSYDITASIYAKKIATQ